MATVTFKLNTYAQTSFNGLAPRVYFKPVSMGTMTGGGSSYLFPTENVPVTIAGDGVSCSANLMPSAWVRPNAYYRLIVEWLDSGGNFTKMDESPWLLFMTPTGGFLDDLLALPTNPFNAYIGTVPPDQWTPPLPVIPGTWWLDSDPTSETYGHLHEAEA